MHVSDAQNEQSGVVVLHSSMNVLRHPIFAGFLILEWPILVHWWGVWVPPQSSVMPGVIDDARIRPEPWFGRCADVGPVEARSRCKSVGDGLTELFGPLLHHSLHIEFRSQISQTLF